MRRLLLFLIVFFCFGIQPLYPYWIWTPKTGKWVNPKTTVKTNPKEQFELARSLFEVNKLEEAKREFKKLMKAYPKSFEASESQYYLGLIEEKGDNLYEAYKAYQKVIDKYPFSERIKEIIEREYKIGEAFMSGGKHKVSVLVENPSIEIFNKVVENSTYGPLASAAQYKLGLVLKGLMRYYEAEEAFNKVISTYPDSEWAAAAKFQIATCRAAVSKGPDYDQGAADEAKGKFADFLQEHPDAVLSREAAKNIDQIREREAESRYDTGRFYEKQKAYEAAKIYYEDVTNNYSESIWAIKSLERLQIMEKRK
jgi:outer membrane protein assembly factor BamD